jgi:hypothetical protein
MCLELLAIAEAVNDASSTIKIINSNPNPFQYIRAKAKPSQAKPTVISKVVDAISIHNSLPSALQAFLSYAPIHKYLIHAKMKCALSLVCRRLFGRSFTVGNVRLHDLVEVGLVDYSAGFGALGLLLQVLTKDIEVELAVLHLGACL